MRGAIGKDMQMHTYFILYLFASSFRYAGRLTITNVMEAAFGHLHKNGRATFDRPSPFVDSIMGGREPESIIKTYANTYISILISSRTWAGIATLIWNCRTEGCQTED